jgi:hypothetical protein
MPRPVSGRAPCSPRISTPHLSHTHQSPSIHQHPFCSNATPTPSQLTFTMSQQNNDNNNNKPSYPKPPAPPAQPLTGMSQETYRRFMEQQGLQPSAWVPEEAIREKRWVPIPSVTYSSLHLTESEIQSRRRRRRRATGSEDRRGEGAESSPYPRCQRGARALVGHTVQHLTTKRID